jgi:hypothetical protein
MTFIIALLHEQQVSNWIIAIFWVILGSASALSSIGWGPILGKLSGGRGPAIVAVVAAVGTLPVLLAPATVSAITSAIIFGGSFMAGPTAITLLARRSLPPTFWAAGIAWLTVAFALGQAAGPLVSGAACRSLRGAVPSSAS